MRWWMNTDHGRFSVDNAVVDGIDVSSLDSSIWMVQWIDGKGEIERQVDIDTNDNGLREKFIDIIPYAPFFQQFLELCPLLTLTQAKKVDIDLIREIFESKRQAPFHYPVAAGDYYWDATDETLFASTAAGLQNTITSLNTVISELNRIVAGFNSVDQTFTQQANDSFNGLASNGDSLVSWITNNVVGMFNTYLKNAGGFAKPGVPTAGVPSCPIDFVPNGVNAGSVSWSNIPPVMVSNTQWIPIGATAPVTVTPAEQSGIMNGIAARTNALNIKKNIKIGEINIMTDIQDVIGYDVTTGW